MKQILILYTGGTIGMDYTDSGVLKITSGLFKLKLDKLAYASNIKIELLEYENLIDSSDINLNVWVKIIEDITENYDYYDGFIIIHGTDTLAYTASVLSFSLKGLSKPVVLTGAQLPLVHQRSDGWGNLEDAICVAVQEEFMEVGVVFNHKLFRGCRVQKISTNKFIGFNSIIQEPLAEFGIDITWYKERWLKPHQFSFLPIIPKDIKILCLSLYPGYTTDFIAKTLQDTDAAGVILRTYGSGNIPMQHNQLVATIKKACDMGIIIVNVSQIIEGVVKHRYTNGNLDELGAVSGLDMTTEAALAKLLVLLSTHMSQKAIKNAIGENLVGELTPL